MALTTVPNSMLTTPGGGGGVTPEYDAGDSSTALNIDFTNGLSQKITLTDNCVFTTSGSDNGTSYLLKLVQDSTGSRTVTWPNTIAWPGGVVPTLTTTPEHTDVIRLYYDGAVYWPYSTLNCFILTPLTPETLDSNPDVVLWLKADAITGYVDDDTLTSWVDSSVTANNAAGGTPATYKTNIIGSLPVVRFSPSQYYEITTDKFDYSSLTVFTVFTRTTEGLLSKCFLSCMHESLGWNMGIKDGVANTVKWYIPAVDVDGPVLTLDTPTVLTGTFNNDTLTGKTYGNGTLVTSTSGLTALPIGGPITTWIGGLAYYGGQYLEGDIAEMIVIKRVLTDAERDDITDYLTTKYGIA
jgi:concanavalin A-like lectin/glucanase superfamily protein